jgi:solute carrier family 25 carnitine/acylcarnitine transporter 20/29
MGFTFLKVVEELLHGSLSGLSMVMVAHPTDTLKTRKQLETFKYHEMIMRMIRKEGILSFYKGVLSPMISMPLYKSVIFATYKLSLIEFEKRKSFNNNRNWQVGVAAFFSGFINSFICGPMELFKVKLQIQKDKKNKLYKGYMDIFRKTYKVSGYRGIFQGTGATIWRDILSYPSAFIVYEKVVLYFGNGEWGKANHFHQFLAGAASGVVSWTIIFPLDVVKSQIQSVELKERVKLFNNFQIWRDMGKIYRINGIGGLFHGMSIFLGRSFFGHGFAFMTWNWCGQNLRFA